MCSPQIKVFFETLKLSKRGYLGKKVIHLCYRSTRILGKVHGGPLVSPGGSETLGVPLLYMVGSIRPLHVEESSEQWFWMTCVRVELRYYISHSKE